MKKFDFSKHKTSPYKKIRTHPSFFTWKKDLWILSIFLSIILLGFFAFMSIQSLQNIAQTSKQTLQKFLSQNKEIHSFEDIYNILDNSATTLEELYENLSTQALPESIGKKVFIKLNNTAKDIRSIQKSWPKLNQAINTVYTEQDFSQVSQYLYKNKDTILRVQAQVQQMFSLLKLSSSNEEKLESMSTLLDYLKNSSRYLYSMEVLLGNKQPHRMVIWLQNSYEKRATGGFIGSFIEVAMNDGKVVQFQTHDIYEYDGQISSNSELPELAKILVGNKFLSLRDSNYSPIFSESAQSFMKLFEISGGQSIDTIIALDNSFIEKLLQFTGPLYLKSLDLELNAQNFSFVTSFLVEGKINNYDPKQVLKTEIIPQFLEKLKNIKDKNTWLKILQLTQENVQIYSEYESINYSADNLNFKNINQSIFDKKENIPVMQVSVSGNKSDAFVEQEWNIHQSDTQIKIDLQRFHNWSQVQEKQFNNLLEKNKNINTPEDVLKNILGHGDNNSIFYLFLPKNAKNIQSSIKDIKTFSLYDRQVLEINLPLLSQGEKQNISISFEINNNEAFNILEL